MSNSHVTLISKAIYTSIVCVLVASSSALASSPDASSGASTTDTGLILISQKRFKEAEAHFKRLLQQAPRSHVYLNNHALALAGLGQFEEALDDLTAAIQIAPTAIDLYANRGDVFQIVHFNKRALADYSKVIELNSKSVRGYKSRGVVLKALHQYKKAAEDYTALVSLDRPNAALYLDNRSYCNKMSGQHAQALADMNHAVDLAPNLPIIYMDRAALLMESGNFRAAIGDYEKALSLNPKLKPALLGRAGCNLKLQGYDKALEDCDAAAKLSPDLSEAALLLRQSADAFLGKGSYEQAAELASRSLDVSPSSAAFLVRAKALFKLGKFNLTILDCDQLLQQQASIPEANILRAASLEKLAEKDQANRQKTGLRM